MHFQKSNYHWKKKNSNLLAILVLFKTFSNFLSVITGRKLIPSDWFLLAFNRTQNLKFHAFSFFFCNKWKIKIATDIGINITEPWVVDIISQIYFWMIKNVIGYFETIIKSWYLKALSTKTTLREKIFIQWNLFSSFFWPPSYEGSY